MATKNKSILLFLIGLFAETEIRVFGSIGISELVIFLVAPFIFLQDFNVIKKQGFSFALTLLVFALFNSMVANLWNNIPIISALKGYAQIYALFAGIVVFRRLLYHNLGSIKYFFVGAFISSIICIFVFQKGVHGGGWISQDEAMQKTIGYAVFWIAKVKALTLLPINGWFLNMPTLYLVLAPLGVALYAIISSESGRSSSLALFATAGLLFIGKKSRKRMASISKHFTLAIILGLIFIFTFKTIYTTLAADGTLGEAIQTKFENQTKGKTDIISILVGGRIDSFVGIFFGVKNPIIGYGAWRVDDLGLYEDFLYKYGNVDDFNNFIQRKLWIQSQGLSHRVLIAAHSVIFCWWCWYGICGFFFWSYVLYLIINLFRKWIAVYPPLFGYFCYASPMYVWHIFFSPFGGRIHYSFYITCILLVKAMYERRIQNDWDLQDEYTKQKYQ